MLEKLITLLHDPHTHSLNDLAHKLDTTPAMVEIMLEDLERMGYVRQVTGCDNSCPSCPTKNTCIPTGQARIWVPVERRP